MKRFAKLWIGIALSLSFVAILVAILSGARFDLLFPAGAVGLAERDLMLHAMGFMLIVVVPLVVFAIFVAYYYRESNHRATYTPNWEHSKLEELVWWSIPLEIVLVLAALTWTSSHELDPGRALIASQAPITIEVVALPWKWLFIYPDIGVASVGEVVLPAGRPVSFLVTADAPMNSFWIPALGGQIYAMTGMTTRLNLIADTPGVYQGSSANYSGEGFAQMKFSARALSPEDFAAWESSSKGAPGALDEMEYDKLRAPSETGSGRYYGQVSPHLFNEIVESFMSHEMEMPIHH